MTKRKDDQSPVIPPETREVMERTLTLVGLTADVMLLEDVRRFQLLRQASFLEGALRLPDGTTVRFEWDADAGDGDLRSVLDQFLTALP